MVLPGWPASSGKRGSSLPVLRRCPGVLLRGLRRQRPDILGELLRRDGPGGGGDHPVSRHVVAQLIGQLLPDVVEAGITRPHDAGKDPALRRQHRSHQGQAYAGGQHRRPQGPSAPLPLRQSGEGLPQPRLKVLRQRRFLRLGQCPQFVIQLLHVASSFSVSSSESSFRSRSRPRLSRDFTVPSGRCSVPAISRRVMSS